MSFLNLNEGLRLNCSQPKLCSLQLCLALLDMVLCQLWLRLCTLDLKFCIFFQLLQYWLCLPTVGLVCCQLQLCLSTLHLELCQHSVTLSSLDLELLATSAALVWTKFHFVNFSCTCPELYPILVMFVQITFKLDRFGENSGEILQI